MNDKIDSVVETTFKKKIRNHYLDLLSKGIDKEQINKKLYKLYEEKLVSEILLEFKNNENIIPEKQTKQINKKYNVSSVINELKKELKEENLKEDHKNNFDYKNYKSFFEEKDKKKYLIQKYPRISIVIFMIILFLGAMISIFIIDTEKGLGSCPYVSDDDLKRISIIFYEKRDAFTYLEYDEIIATYFGKKDCMFIDKNTIKKIRELS